MNETTSSAPTSVPVFLEQLNRLPSLFLFPFPSHREKKEEEDGHHQFKAENGFEPVGYLVHFRALCPADFRRFGQAAGERGDEWHVTRSRQFHPHQRHRRHHHQQRHPRTRRQVLPKRQKVCTSFFDVVSEGVSVRRPDRWYVPHELNV